MLEQDLCMYVCVLTNMQQDHIIKVSEMVQQVKMLAVQA